MASIIDASTAGVGGIITTADNTGNLNIQSGGSTKIAVTSSGVAVTGLSKASLPTGSVLQVVNATYSTQVSTGESTYSDTGLTATITPTSDTSKILILVNQTGCGKSSANTSLRLQLLRNSTVLISFERSGGDNNATTTNRIGSCSTAYLDSPATTSAITYKTQLANALTSGLGSAAVQLFSSVSTITLMEIAA